MMVTTTMNRFTLHLCRLFLIWLVSCLDRVLSAYDQLQVGNDEPYEAIIYDVILSVVE